MNRASIFLFFFITSSSLFSEDTLGKKNAVGITPIYAGAIIDFEHRIAPWASIYVPTTIAYTDFGPLEHLLDNIDPVASTLFGLKQGETDLAIFSLMTGIGIKFYFNGSSIGDSWYAKTSVEAGYLKYMFQGDTNGAMAEINLTFGYNWVFDDGFLFGLGLGAASAWLFLEDHTKWLPLPKLDLTFGYAW